MRQTISRDSLHTLVDGANWQHDKLFSLVLVFVASIGFASCLAALLMPHLNDAFSGAPDYLSAIANVTAERLAKQLSGLYPVFVAKDEHVDCPMIQGSVPAIKVYYVIRFSETRNRLCVTKYADAEPKENVPDAIISEQMGHNFGPPLASPVHVVAIGQNTIDFPGIFLSSLHWRQRAEPGKATSNQTLIQDLQGLSIDISALKANISYRHRMLNRCLLCGVGLTLLTMIWTSRRLRVQFVSMRQYCSPHNGSLAFMTYLLSDLGCMLARARKLSIDKQVQFQTISRMARIARRKHTETRRVLAAHLETVTEQELRIQIQDCLIKDEFENMKVLLETILAHPREQSPNERLNRFLEYLKEYCTNEEFQSLSLEAVTIMQRHGFRSARRHVVDTRRDLQIRALQAEQEQVQTDRGQPYSTRQ